MLSIWREAAGELAHAVCLIQPRYPILLPLHSRSSASLTPPASGQIEERVQPPANHECVPHPVRIKDAALRSTLNHLPHLGCQLIEREWLGDHLHAVFQKPRTGAGVFGVAGDEQHLQLRAHLSADIG